MTDDDLSLSADQFNCILIRDLLTDLCRPDDTAEIVRERAAMVIAMFRAMAPENANQATIAATCIALRFMLHGAIRAANASLGDTREAKAAQAAVRGLNRDLSRWTTILERVRARDARESRDARERKAAEADPPPVPRPAAPSIGPSEGPPAMRVAERDAPVATVPWNVVSGRPAEEAATQVPATIAPPPDGPARAAGPLAEPGWRDQEAEVTASIATFEPRSRVPAE
jgi:hypothetical protein